MKKIGQEMGHLSRNGSLVEVPVECKGNVAGIRSSPFKTTTQILSFTYCHLINSTTYHNQTSENFKKAKNIINLYVELYADHINVCDNACGKKERNNGSVLVTMGILHNLNISRH